MNHDELMRLADIAHALNSTLGDTDPYFSDDMTDEDIRAEEPVWWATRELNVLIDEPRRIAQGAKTGGVPDDDWHLKGYAYASKQATNCAGCGEHKHTPLRVDEMGGYVCLTCIDKKLEELLDVPPANPPEAGVTDEMVERLAKHLCREEWKDRCPTIEQMTAQLKHVRRYHDEARAMLTAALTPQPNTEDTK